MKFSIRDVLWLTIAVALAVAWGLDRRAASIREATLKEQLKAKTMDAEYTRAILQVERALQNADSTLGEK